MNTTQLTEKEAWLKIAEHFKKWPMEKFDENYYIICDGICICVERLHWTKQISSEVFISMNDKIPNRKRYRSGYVWKYKSKRSNQARVKFCLERASEL
jgi:hypothetical protein